jgi:uncharacterized protein
VRFVYATDLHGDADAYGALAELVLGEGPDVLLLGGDLFAYNREGAPQVAFADAVLRPFLERLQEAGTPVALVHGNVDRRGAVERLRVLEDAGLCRVLTLQPTPLVPDGAAGAQAWAVGYPLVPPTGFRLKDHERRDRAGDRFRADGPVFVSSPDPHGAWVEMPSDHLDRLPSIEEDLADAPRAAAPWLLVAHAPPLGVLDMCADGAHAGSRALLDWIAERRPPLALHGHVHEAPDTVGRWAERLHDTTCVNPGAAGEHGLQAVVGQLAGDVLSLRHTTRGEAAL